jgi:hypothetical protein
VPLKQKIFCQQFVYTSTALLIVVCLSTLVLTFFLISLVFLRLSIRFQHIVWKSIAALETLTFRSSIETAVYSCSDCKFELEMGGDKELIVSKSVTSAHYEAIASTQTYEKAYFSVPGAYMDR